MLTAMRAVGNLVICITAKDNIRAVNTEMEFHEEIEEKPTAAE